MLHRDHVIEHDDDVVIDAQGVEVACDYCVTCSHYISCAICGRDLNAQEIAIKLDYCELCIATYRACVGIAAACAAAAEQAHASGA